MADNDVYKLKREEITENVVVIKINKLYKKGMSAEALYEATRGVWRRKIESVQPADYALSVTKGIILEVFKIDQWYPAGTFPMKTREVSAEHCKGRIEFIGSVAEQSIREKYIGKSVAGLYKNGEADPLKVFLTVDIPTEEVSDISELSINDPIKPQALSMDGENETVQCPRCDIWFQKAKRCPECGQMILYQNRNVLSFANQLKKSGLDLETNWKGDMRDRFIDLLTSILDGTEYYFEKNKTDSSDYYLELHKMGEKKRLLGFSGKKEKRVRIFFQHYVYEMVNKRYPLPDNMYPKKTQEHILVPLSELWNIICVIADKQDFMIKTEK